jgi:hypothetical protein
MMLEPSVCAKTAVRYADHLYGEAGPREGERGQQHRLYHDCCERFRSDRFRFWKKFAFGCVAIAHHGSGDVPAWCPVDGRGARRSEASR